MQPYQLSYPVPQNPKEAIVSWVLRGLTLRKWLEAQGIQRWQQGREGSPVLCPTGVTAALMQSDSSTL